MKAADFLDEAPSAVSFLDGETERSADGFLDEPDQPEAGFIEGVANAVKSGVLGLQNAFTASTVPRTEQLPPAGFTRRDAVRAFNDPRYAQAQTDAMEVDMAGRSVLDPKKASLAREIGPGGITFNRQQNIEAGIRGASAEIADRAKAQQALPRSKSWQDFQKAEGAKDWLGVFAAHPVDIIANIIGESAAPSAVGVAGFMAGGPAGAGVASGTTENAMTLLSAASDAGYDLTDERQVADFFMNRKALAEARTKAIQRGVPIGVFDAFTAGMAGKFLGKAIGQGPLKVGAATAAESGVQIAGGAGGEAAAQLASEGRITSGKDIFTEAVGEFGPASVYEAASNIRRERAGTKQAETTPTQTEEPAKQSEPAPKQKAARPETMDDLAARSDEETAELSAEELQDLEAIIRGNQLAEEESNAEAGTRSAEPTESISPAPVESRSPSVAAETAPLRPVAGETEPDQPPVIDPALETLSGNELATKKQAAQAAVEADYSLANQDRFSALENEAFRRQWTDIEPGQVFNELRQQLSRLARFPSKASPARAKVRLLAQELIRQNVTPAEALARVKISNPNQAEVFSAELRTLKRELEQSPLPTKPVVESERPIGLPQPSAAQGSESRVQTEQPGESGPLAAEPWQMTAKEWQTERDNLRAETFGPSPAKAPTGAEVRRINRIQQLVYGVADEASATLAAAQKGEITLSPDQLEDVMDRINTLATHKDVVEKAVREGKPIPERVLRDYPELSKPAADPIESALRRAIDATTPDPTKLAGYILPTWIPQAAANGALRVMLAAYVGGKKIKATIDAGVFWIEQNYPALRAREKELRAEFAKMLKDAGLKGRARAYSWGPTRRLWAERFLGKEGTLPKAWRPILQQQANNRQTIEEAVKVRVADTQAQLEREFKTEADRAAAKERLLQFWSGDATVTVGSPELNKRAAAVRNYIDTLTTIAVKGGMFSPERGEKILGNVGSWLRRSYLAFDPAMRWDYDTLQRRYLAGDAEIKRIWNAAEAFLRQQNPQATDDEITTQMKTLVNRQEMEGLMEGILSGRGPSASNKAGIDVSSLIRRKDIPLEIREWMGEIKDPFNKVLSSSKWMAQFMARHEAQKRMAEVGLNNGLFSQKQTSVFTEQLYPNELGLMPALDKDGNPLPPTPDGRIPAEYRSKINERYNPLHGLWTTPELAAALENYEATATEGATLIDATKSGYLWALGLAKSNLVGNNPYSWPANIMGGLFMNLANGYANPYRYKRAWDAVRKGADSIDPVATKQAIAARANYLAAVKSGVLDAGLYAADLRATLGDQFASPESWTEAKKSLQAAAKILRESKGADGKADMAKALQNFVGLPAHYMMTTPDNLFRVNAFLSELELAKQAFPSMSQKEQIQWAGERASNVYQTYAKLPAGVRAASRLPILGTFVQFKLELMRNTYWTLRYAVQDMRSDNPALRRNGAERMISLFATVGGAVALANGGDDDTEEKKKALQRSFVPPWDRNEVILVVDRQGTKWKYASLSYIVPHIELVKLYNAAERMATRPDEEAGKVIDGLMDDYLGPGIVVGPLIEAITNQRLGTDGKITLRNDVSGVARRLNHAVKNFIPGEKYATVLGDLWKGATGETGDYGKTYDVEDVAKRLLGLRVRSMDVEQTLGYRMAAMTREWRDASANANLSQRRDAGKPDRLAEEAGYTQRTKEELRKAYSELLQDARTTGVPESVIRAKEKDFAVPTEMRR